MPNVLLDLIESSIASFIDRQVDVSNYRQTGGGGCVSTGGECSSASECCDSACEDGVCGEPDVIGPAPPAASSKVPVLCVSVCLCVIAGDMALSLVAAALPRPKHALLSTVPSASPPNVCLTLALTTLTLGACINPAMGLGDGQCDSGLNTDVCAWDLGE